MKRSTAATIIMRLGHSIASRPCGDAMACMVWCGLHAGDASFFLAVCREAQPNQSAPPPVTWPKLTDFTYNFHLLACGAFDDRRVHHRIRRDAGFPLIQQGHSIIHSTLRARICLISCKKKVSV